jgi:hypothetical protein
MKMMIMMMCPARGCLTDPHIHHHPAALWPSCPASKTPLALRPPAPPLAPLHLVKPTRLPLTPAPRAYVCLSSSNAQPILRLWSVLLLRTSVRNHERACAVHGTHHAADRTEVKETRVTESPTSPAMNTAGKTSPWTFGMAWFSGTPARSAPNPHPRLAFAGYGLRFGVSPVRQHHRNSKDSQVTAPVRGSAGRVCLSSAVRVQRRERHASCEQPKLACLAWAAGRDLHV